MVEPGAIEEERLGSSWDMRKMIVVTAFQNHP